MGGAKCRSIRGTDGQRQSGEGTSPTKAKPTPPRCAWQPLGRLASRLRLKASIERKMRNGGAAHKNMKAPQSINNGDAMSWHSSH